MIRPLKILIVEDDAFQAQIVQQHINEQGHVVYLASTPEEAIDAVKDSLNEETKRGWNPYDIIFIDYKLPRMKGVALSRKLKSISSEPVHIALTAYDTEQVKQEICSEKTFEGVLSKSDEFKVLDRIIASVISKIKSKG